MKEMGKMEKEGGEGTLSHKCVNQYIFIPFISPLSPYTNILRGVCDGWRMTERERRGGK